MPNLTQFDLLSWLVAKDKPLGDRIVNLRANGGGTNRAQLIADTQYERSVIATLADLVRASALPKHSPGMVGKPKPSPASAGIEGTPVTDLSQVMDEEEEVPAPEAPAPTAATLAPPAGRHPVIQGILDEGKKKLEAQRERAARMREVKYAKQRAAKEAQPESTP